VRILVFITPSRARLLAVRSLTGSSAEAQGAGEAEDGAGEGATAAA